MRRCSGLMAAMMFSTLCVAAISDDAKLRYLPFGFYPTIEKQTRVESRPVESLPREVEALTKELGNTVKTIASHRNTTCFDNPCLFQAFPLIYERINSGFFGGARVKLTDVSRQRPYLYSLEGLLVRSDTQQWSVFLGADFPQIELVPFEPRLKVNFNYSRTTETKYFGSGSSFLAKVDPLDDNYRYALSELGYQSSLIVPITKFGEQKFGIFGNFSSIKNRPQPFADQAQSPLYNDQPTGIEGGYSTRVGAGVIIDSRDQEVLSRSGSALEVAIETAGPPLGNFRFQRITVIDRRYLSSGRLTVGNRTTVDTLFGDPPFWELTGVGGIDPVKDIARSQLLVGFAQGRYHEKLKIINSSESRIYLEPRRYFGLYTLVVLMPVAVTLARLGTVNTWGLATGSKFLINGNFQIQTYLGFSKGWWTLRLDFGQSF